MQVPDLRFGYAPLPAPAPGYDPAGDARALAAPGVPSPATRPIPGSVDFAALGPGHRFVVRIPADWNGDLAVCGTPAMRSECANDLILGDFLMARGYAFAASNKGIAYTAVLESVESADRSISYVIPFDSTGVPKNAAALRLGALETHADVAAWHADLARLTQAAKERIAALRGRAPRRTYALGLSLGGGQVRWLLERHPELVDGGLEWVSVYWHPERNLLTSLPAFLAAMPAYVAHDFEDRAAHAAIVAAGFPPDRRAASEHRSLWDDHYRLAPWYADLTVFTFAKLLDSAAPVDTLEARAAYRLSARARERIAGFAQTGVLGRPLIALAGASDVFVAPQQHAAPYFEAVQRSGCAAHYRQYIVADAPHVDGYAAFGYGLQPQLPFVWRAFERLVDLVESGRPLRAAAPSFIRSPDQID